MNYPILSLFLFLVMCQQQTVAVDPAVSDEFRIDPEAFSAYWYSGKAELASYHLKQSRYGEDREGSAVLIFVTEPFSESKQVKLDDAETEGAVTVMKLNFTRKFITGIYPYSMMMSVFTPVSADRYPYSLKLTMSSQEWCGQTFTQLNLDRSNYRATRLSYFESEGDTFDGKLKGIPEDELWNRIRIDPDGLPRGTFQLIPGTFFSRFSHNDALELKADGELIKGDSTSTYRLLILDQERELSIDFESHFPFRIVSWNETIKGELMSSGKLKKVLHTDYWNQNASRFEYLRDSLELN